MTDFDSHLAPGNRREIVCQSSIVDAKAFTLIELLVVIAAIALLMAVLMPALSRARKQARAVVCRSHLKQWGTAMALYTEDHEGCIPADLVAQPGLSLLRGLYLSQEGPDPNPARRSHPVLTEGISCCPMATRTLDDTTYGYAWLNKGEYYLRVKGGGTFVAWNIVIPEPAFRGSYGLNANIFNPMNFGIADDPRIMLPSMGGAPNRRRGVNTHSLRQCQSIPFLLDATIPSYRILDSYTPHETEPEEVNGNFCINRHYGTINGLFLDWSVRPAGLKELWTLKWSLKFDVANKWTRAGGVKPEDWPQWMRAFKDY